MNFQKLKRVCGDEYIMAERYCSIIAAVNNIPLTNREIQLLAFAAIRGNISYKSTKEDFCKKHSTTIPTITNSVYKLKAMGLFIKENNKIKIHPLLSLNFNEATILEIKLVKDASPDK
jgi:hypothetical protein